MDKQQKNPAKRVQPARELDEGQLDGVAAGALIKDGTSNITDGTSNTKSSTTGNLIGIDFRP